VNKQAIIFSVGKLLQIMALIMVVPALIAFFSDIPEKNMSALSHPVMFGFLISICTSLLAGSLAVLLTRQHRNEIRVREGYAVVTFGWLTLSMSGCLPLFVYFYMSGDGNGFFSIVEHFTNAFFETVSGFTTTGATILTSIETMPRGLLFWRSLTHWLGGMGIITLALALFPAMGVSGYGMFKGEVPGPSKKRLMPRLSETAKVLWMVYLGFTVLQTLLLMAGGMSLFDSLCHTFGTLATGGFSTQDGSIGQYGNPYFNWIIIVFMFLSGVNYVIHYQVFIKRRTHLVLKDRELVFYISTVVIAILFFTSVLYFSGLPKASDTYAHYRYDRMTFTEFQAHVNSESEKVQSLYGAFSEASFQVVSILTTTGYVTADFDIWPAVCRFMLLILMFWGACAGSTGGGMKIVRVMTVLRVSWRELGKLARPRLVIPFKIGDETLPENRVLNILALFNLVMIIFVIATAIMCLYVDDLVTAIASVVACLFNIGPGLNGVGAIENYAWIPLPGKWVLSLCMLMGRLEVFAVLITLRPDIWRK
jgi:trk system potassium uptake protein